MDISYSLQYALPSGQVEGSGRYPYSYETNYHSQVISRTLLREARPPLAGVYTVALLVEFSDEATRLAALPDHHRLSLAGSLAGDQP